MQEIISDYFRKAGMKIGEGCNICCNIMTMEPFMVEMGENVTVSGDVSFVTHDNSVMKVNPKCYNLFGFIRIGDNCFIGERSIIMYGVTLANNIIVASGSVVCHSFSEERIIIGGNPARKIGTWDDFIKRNAQYALGRAEAREKAITNPELFIEKKDRSKS